MDMGRSLLARGGVMFCDEGGARRWMPSVGEGIESTSSGVDRAFRFVNRLWCREMMPWVSISGAVEPQGLAGHCNAV
jgi:hypothetical protein